MRARHSRSRPGPSLLLLLFDELGVPLARHPPPPARGVREPRDRRMHCLVMGLDEADERDRNQGAYIW